MKLVHWPLMGGLLHLVHRGGAWAGCGPPPSFLLAVPNVTAHPSTASAPINYCYISPLFCCDTVTIKGLILRRGVFNRTLLKRLKNFNTHHSYTFVYFYLASVIAGEVLFSVSSVCFCVCCSFINVSGHIQVSLLLPLQHWNDYNLAWNASDYGGVQSIRVPSTMIWKPDILMYNRLAMKWSYI